MEGVENSSIDIDSITPEISTAASEADYEAKHIIPLASLTPETATNGALVKVVVVLLFPYSPSTQTLRLVLSEEDFRLRENKGQLRVSFHGAAASKLAGKNVDIGDVLVLSTREARFHKLRNATLRDVPWSLRFDEGLLVKLKVKGAGEWDTLEVNEAHEEKGDDGGSAADTAALPGSGLTSSSGASPGPSEGSQREWRMPASFKRTALPPEPLTTFLGELLDEEELLEEQEQEPVRKKPRFTQSRYRLVSGDEEQWDKPHRPDRGTQYIGSFDPPDQITVPVDNPPTASTPTITVSSEPDTLQQRLEVPPPRLTVYDELHPEVPDSPDLKPVDSSGLPLISPLEHRGLSFSDYMGTRLEGPVGSHSFVGRGFGGSSSHVSLAESAGEQVFISSPPYELDITPSRSESSTGPNSLFDSLSPTPVQELLSEERGKSPVHPSPLRIVENFSSTLQQEPSPQQHSASRPAGKTPLLLPQVSPIQETPKSLAALEHVLQPEPLEGKRPGEPITPETSTKRGMARREGDPMFGIGSPLDAFFGKAEVPVGSLQEGDESSGEKIPEDTKIEVFVNQNTRNIKNQNILTSLSTTQSRPSSSTTTIRKFKSGVTTTLCDYPALLHLTWGHTQDFIGVVCRTKPVERAKRGQKDFFLSMRVVDSSLPRGITVSILRPFKDALPEVEGGDCMLFRNFKISSYKHNLVATSCSTSAYAVWCGHRQVRQAVVVGPPVEYGDGEEDYVRGLKAWFESLDGKTKEELSRWPDKSRKTQA